MTKTYRYQPPLFYIFAAPSAVYASYIFLKSIRLEDFGKNLFQISTGFIGLTLLILGLMFLKTFVYNLSFSSLKLGRDFIQIPVRWKKTNVVSFADIEKIEVNNNKTIAISTRHGLHTVDSGRMANRDFQELREILSMINNR